MYKYIHTHENTYIQTCIHKNTETHTNIKKQTYKHREKDKNTYMHINFTFLKATAFDFSLVLQVHNSFYLVNCSIKSI